MTRTPQSPHAPLSSYWRKNRTSVESAELAHLLRALRKVAGHLGPNAGRIEYTGMSHGEAAAIVVDPTVVMGDYPVPPEKVDYLVGLVVHEALLRIEWSERVFRLLQNDFAAMGGLSRVIFQRIIQTGESIYVDRIADRSIMGKYVVQTRGRALMEARAKLRSEILTVDAMIYYWWVSTWSPGIRDLVEPVYEPPLAALSALTASLEKTPDQSRSVTERCRIRADHYLSAWEKLRDTAMRLTVLDKRLVWSPEGVAVRPGGEPERRLDRKKKPPLSALLIAEIETELAAHQADITPIIRSVAGWENEDVAPTSRWDYNIPAHPVIDPRTVARLKAIFLNYAERNQVVSRGLTSGKVDGRRLFRAPVSGRCFRHVERIPSVNWNVTLLLDATGSMRGGRWRMVENTVGNLHRALLGFKNRLNAYAYFEMDGICMVSSLIKGRNLLSVPPAGRTASGQALIAAAWFMPKDGRRNLLIHVTDGESNFGVDVATGIEYCGKKNIHLVTLGCGTRDRKTMRSQYGNTIQFLNHFGQLPGAIEKLLKWTFLYGAKSRPAGDKRLARLFDPGGGGE